MSKANNHSTSHEGRAATIAARLQHRIDRLGDDAGALLYVGEGIAASRVEQDVLVGLMVVRIAERFQKKINRTHGDLDLIVGMPKGVSAKMREAAE